MKIVEYFERHVDKLAHFGVGAGLAALVWFVMTLFGAPLAAKVVVPNFVVLVAAIWREEYGAALGRKRSFRDVFATALGAAVFTFPAFHA